MQIILPQENFTSRRISGNGLRQKTSVEFKIKDLVRSYTTPQLQTFFSEMWGILSVFCFNALPSFLTAESTPRNPTCIKFCGFCVQKKWQLGNSMFFFPHNLIINIKFLAQKKLCYCLGKESFPFSSWWLSQVGKTFHSSLWASDLVSQINRLWKRPASV